MTAPRVCAYCMYAFTNPDRPYVCGLFHRNIIGDAKTATCGKWQIGYYGHKYEADQVRAEMIEREKRRAEAPVQLDLFGDGNDL
jgi:hypothetical protein